MSSGTLAAERLYRGIDAHDPSAILDALSDDFVGEASAGMPLGVGGRHEGKTAMLRVVWAPVFAAYDIRVEVDRYLEAGEGTVVAVGTYRGSERSTGRALDARFAHILTIRDDRVSGLEQITDTRRWVADG